MRIRVDRGEHRVGEDQKLLQGVDVSSSIFRAERRDFREEYLSRLQTPAGFKVSVFASGLGRPRMIVVADDGTVTRRGNDVVALKDTDGDGKSDEMKIVLKDFPQVHGIALRGNQVYLATPGEVWISERSADGSLSTPPSGFKVVHVKFENGSSTGYEDFVTGFTLDDGAAQFGRPTGLALAKDGALLISDDLNGVIYRVSYAK